MNDTTVERMVDNVWVETLFSKLAKGDVFRSTYKGKLVTDLGGNTEFIAMKINEDDIDIHPYKPWKGNNRQWV